MGTMITLTAADGHQLGAYRAEPEGTPKGGVVVIQEIFGVNQHIREVADGYAEAGYLAIAPAMFDRAEAGVELGYDADGIEKGLGFARPADLDQAMADIAAAADAASEGGKVGVTGYCWGGLLVWLSVSRLADKLAAGSAYYGGRTVDYLTDSPKVPLIMHFGELDQGITQDQVEKIRETVPDVPVYVYEGADHGFNCDHRSTHNADAAALAKQRTLEFFAETLQ